MIFWRAAGGFFGNLFTDFPLETAILESRKVKIFRPPGLLKTRGTMSYNSTDRAVHLCPQ